MHYQPIISRCPETNALVFATPPEVLAEQARQRERDADHLALVQLVSQLLAAQPKAVTKQLDPALLARFAPES